MDPELVRQATPLLSTAVAVLIEDEHLGAAKAAGTPEEEAQRGERLLQLGLDVVALASAIGVLTRRVAPTTKP